MKGNSEFLILFIPFLAVGIIALYGALLFPLKEILINDFVVLIAQAILIIIAIFCFAVDIFALMVQYVNWKYYKEE